MPYWGKLAGVIAGLATGRPWLALLGLVLGHQFDRGVAKYFAERASRADEHPPMMPESYLKPLFQAMGYLAKSDGRVSEEEIRAARVMMHRLALGPERIREAIRWFEAGKRRGFPLEDTIRRVRNDTRGTREHRTLFVRLLLEVALSKKTVDRKQRAVIWTVCRELDIGRVELAQLEAMLRAQRGFRRSPAGESEAERVRRAYSILGVNQGSTNDEIKQAYRRLMSRNHPDKLSGARPDGAAVAAAAKKTREIRGAYDMLRARRSIR